MLFWFTNPALEASNVVTPDKVWKAGSRTSRGRMNRDEGALRDEKGRAVGKKSLARPVSALDVVRPRI